LYRDAALADSSRLMLREEEDSSRYARTKTIRATVLETIPAQKTQLTPPLVEMETDDDGVRRRPTYKDSFGSVRPLAAAPALKPSMQPPAHKNESAPDATNTGATRRPVYKNGFGSARFLVAPTAAAVRPHVQKKETAPDEDEAVRIRRRTYMDRADTHPSTMASMPMRLLWMKERLKRFVVQYTRIILLAFGSRRPRFHHSRWLRLHPL
jgi:hypothetical protein